MKNISEINSTVMTLSELFEKRMIYIAKYQREYSWKSSNVRDFFDDVCKDLDQKDFKIFSLGTILATQSEFTYTIIDGQQRLTSTYILLAAIRNQLKNLKVWEEVREIEKILIMNIDGEKRCRIEPQHPESVQIMNTIAKGERVSGVDPPAANYKIAYDLLTELVEERFEGEVHRLTDLTERLRKFTAVVVNVAPEEDAVVMYIRENDRGVPLSAADILKARLYNNAAQHERAKVAETFNVFLQRLWESGEGGDRVILHLATALVTEGKRTLTQCTNLLTEEAMGQEFAYINDSLIPAAESYTNITSGKRNDGSICPSLKDITDLERLRRFKGYRPVLVAARDMPHDDYDELAGSLRDFMLVCSIAGASPPEAETFFAKWAYEIRRGDPLREIIRDINNQKNSHQENFWSRLSQLTYKELGGRGVKFLLGLVERHLKTVGGFSSPAQRQPIFLEFGEKVDVEHILPLNQKRSLGEAGELSLLANRLGNLTLLEASINRSLQNSNYESKLIQYANSNFLITKSLSVPIDAGARNSKLVVAAEKLKQFNSWNENSISEREIILYRLLGEVLGISGEPTFANDMSSLEVSFFQARPENCMRALKVLRNGPAKAIDLKEHLSTKRSNRGSTTRQVGYVTETLILFGVVEKGEDEEFALSDFGRELFKSATSDELIKMRLSKAFYLWAQSDSQILEIVQMAKSSPSSAREKLMQIKNLSAATADHRITAIMAFLAIGDDGCKREGGAQ